LTLLLLLTSSTSSSSIHFLSPQSTKTWESYERKSPPVFCKGQTSFLHEFTFNCNNLHFQRRANKYGAIRTVFNGRKYDSKHEAGVAQDLDLLLKSGVATAIEPQKTFLLYGKNGGKVGSWRADFFVTFKDGHSEVFEAKGLEFADFRLKRNLFEDNYPEIPLTIIKGKTWFRVL
jgi:hypothetical protein